MPPEKHRQRDHDEHGGDNDGCGDTGVHRWNMPPPPANSKPNRLLGPHPCFNWHGPILRRTSSADRRATRDHQSNPDHVRIRLRQRTRLGLGCSSLSLNSKHFFIPGGVASATIESPAVLTCERWHGLLASEMESIPAGAAISVGDGLRSVIHDSGAEGRGKTKN